MNSKEYDPEEIVIGVIADTHGLLDPALVKALEGVSLILHAGDFDTPDILPQLETIAPVRAVRGNMDSHPQLANLPATLLLEIGGVSIYVLHDLLRLDIDPSAAGVQVLIHGHLHFPEIRNRQGVLYINPGSPTSPRRGTRSGFVRLTIRGQTPNAKWIPLD
jgi:putative phosphoesterase